MGISIDPSLILNAATYSGGFNAVPMNLCKQPPEGLKCVPISVSPLATSGAVYVDLSNGPAPVISQAASIFIDASKSSSDITVFFIDTGYQFPVVAGNAQLVPVFTGNSLPKFYIIFGNNTAYSINDIANVIVLNQFIPEFGANNIVKAELITPITGISPYGVSAPFIAQNTAISQSVPAGGGPAIVPGFGATQAYLAGLNIVSSFTDHTFNYGNMQIIMYADSSYSTILMEWDLLIPCFDRTAEVYQVQPNFVCCDLTGINIVSNNTAGVSKFPVSVNYTNTGSIDGAVRVNYIGGILIA